MTQRSLRLHSVKSSVLVVVDIQEKLLPVIPDRQSIVENTRFLLNAAHVLNVAALVTEQYPKGLGTTVPELGQHPAVQGRYEKLRFSAAESIEGSGVASPTASGAARQIILTGIETHICILQTALDLIDLGHAVTLAVDATGSRFASDRETALKRIEAAGVTLASVESIAFEWCEVAGTESFKAISRLVRDRVSL